MEKKGDSIITGEVNSEQTDDELILMLSEDEEARRAFLKRALLLGGGMAGEIDTPRDYEFLRNGRECGNLALH